MTEEEKLAEEYYLKVFKPIGSYEDDIMQAFIAGYKQRAHDHNICTGCYNPKEMERQRESE